MLLATFARQKAAPSTRNTGWCQSARASVVAPPAANSSLGTEMEDASTGSSPCISPPRRFMLFRLPM
jgi:hypothetical protein